MKNPAFFSSREALEAEIKRLALGISLEPEIRETLKPATIGGRKVDNRYVIQPMEGCDGTADGRPDELTYHRWGRFARGGAGVLWGEAIAIQPDARANSRQLLLTRDTLPDVAKLVAFARKEGGDKQLIGLQLTHSGRWSHGKPVGLFKDPALRDVPILTDDELLRIQDTYVEAALLAKKAGVDFIDIKQCHRYLLSELLAARTRPGRFGGDLEKRTSFVVDLLRRIRSEAGRDLILASRMNAYDGLPFVKDEAGKGRAVQVERPYRFGFGVYEGDPAGLDLAEPLEAVARFVHAGLQFLNVTAGCPYFNFHVGRPADSPPFDGYELPEDGLVGTARHFAIAAAIQLAFRDLPVVGTGYSYLRHFLAMAGEANVRAKRIGFVGVGRGAIAYPDFVRDLESKGRMEKLKACITVSHCTNLMRSKGNALGQYAAGCVPRDKVYAKLFQEATKGRRP